MSLLNCDRRCLFTFQQGNLSYTRAWYTFVIAFYSDFLERYCRFIRLVNCLKRLKGLLFKSLLCKQRRKFPPRFSRSFCNWQCWTSWNLKREKIMAWYCISNKSRQYLSILNWRSNSSEEWWVTVFLLTDLFKSAFSLAESQNRCRRYHLFRW